MKKIIYLAAAAIALALGGLAFQTVSSSAAPKSTFVMLDGSTKDTTQFKGKVILVNFWATSCAPCVAEMPELISTFEKYSPRGFDTIAVAMRYDPPSHVLSFSQTRGLPFSVAIDNTGEIAKAWGGIELTPTTFIVNQRGDIVKRYVGEPDFVELHHLLETLLTEV